MIDENLMKFIEDYPKLVKSLISHNLFNFNLRKRLKSFSKILQSSDFSLEQSNDIFTEYFDATVCLRTNYLNATCPVEINISKLRKKVINKPTVNIVTEQLYNLVLDSTKNEYDPLFNSNINDETVVLLSHKKPDGHINVNVEFGEGEGKVPLDNIAKRAEEYKPKERVTYKMIKEYIEAKYGFKVHTAYIAEVKRDLGLPMYDAPNAVEELKQPRKHPTAEKVEAIKDALKHFEVI